jgi:hypothetical protein
MSHTARVKVEFRNLEHLAEACRRVGLELVENQTTFYHGRECLHAVRAKSAEQLRACAEAHIACEFPIGLQAARSGKGFDLVFESMQSSFCRPAAMQLKQSYAAVAAVAAARKQGFRVQERRLETGEIKLVFSK